MNLGVKDQKERLKALDPSESFIVQAPAGSGKTELLTQRFLVLLAIVKKVPEEVVAITFTRKAATEMRARILEALYNAATKVAPEAPHALKTWELARKVLERDNASNWNLLNNPNRLRILTIDALCARIAKSAPLVSNFGTVPQVIEDAFPLYREAAQSLLSSLDKSSPFNDALETLLLHLDNNYLLAENLFVGMLCRRDQWLSHIINQSTLNDSRAMLEMGLGNLIVDTLKNAHHLFSAPDKEEITKLACFAAEMLKHSDAYSNICHCRDLKNFPEPNIGNYEIWQGIAELLLTSAYEWRRAPNKNCGFPAASSALNQEEANLFKNKKERMQRLLVKLSDNEKLRISLKEILLLPPSTYSEKQWEIVNALTKMLPVLVAHLKIIFRDQNVIDFIAIAEGAIHALGDSENPSDIALNLDYQIQHLLVDEFQDTSVTQYRLFELLTAGWEKNDGRTLFLVGDPMQSIYRFREAEVGIFLRVKKFGLNHVKLNPLTLEVNFRSDSIIVEWFNKSFDTIFPSYEDSDLGAISFSPSVSFSKNQKGKSFVKIHSLLDPDENDEAYCITEIVKQELAIDFKKSIAILVRGRSHLQAIIPALKSIGIAFQAIEIEKLFYSAAVQDAFALTKAMLRLGDRIAWLAILRAPWCGLELADLYAIANYDLSSTIFNTLQNFRNIETLSSGAAMRLARIFPILEAALKERARTSLRTWIATIWNKLGGPACLLDAHEIKNIETYFELLDTFSAQAVIDLDSIEQKLLESYCHTSSSNANIHLMTIHKAKGLEFDTVIIPGLERKSALDESRLLIWLERQNSLGQVDLILAPIKSQEDEFDPIYRYIRTQITLKAQYEISRLLYVAVSRAKSVLHLVGSVYSNEDEIKLPPVGSFLNLLWPGIENEFMKNLSNKSSSQEEIVNEQPQVLHRLLPDWKLPDILNLSEPNSLTLTQASFTWSKPYLNHVGTVIHQTLQKMCDQKLLTLHQIDFEQQNTLWRKKLTQLGVSEEKLFDAISMIEKAIKNTLNDIRGQWILSDQHQEANNEFPLTHYVSDEVHHYIIDRTFVDDKNTRWIIDYKCTEIAEDPKLHYGTQLENYAKVMQVIDKRPIKLGLYFPLYCGWFEWEYK